MGASLLGYGPEALRRVAFIPFLPHFTRRLARKLLHLNLPSFCLLLDAARHALSAFESFQSQFNKKARQLIRSSCAITLL